MPEYTLHLKTIHKDLYLNHQSAYGGDAGVDLFFPSDLVVFRNSTMLIDLEVSCKLVNGIIPESFFLFPRSSIYKTPLRLANSVGIIDSNYRGNIKVAVDNISDEDYNVTKGTKLFQVCKTNLQPFKVKLVDNLGESERMDAGFGSSGI
jgi:dUTP pyrophosphatase